MIRSFKDPRTERLFHGEEVREYLAFVRQAEKRLRVLDAADPLRALQMLPSNRPEALKGTAEGSARQQLGEELEAIEPRVQPAGNA
jgi:toxin HigB-1